MVAVAVKNIGYFLLFIFYLLYFRHLSEVWPVNRMPFHLQLSADRNNLDEESTAVLLSFETSLFLCILSTIWSSACDGRVLVWMKIWPRTFHTWYCLGVLASDQQVFAFLKKPCHRFCRLWCPSEHQNDHNRFFDKQTISDTGCKSNARWFWKSVWTSS